MYQPLEQHLAPEHLDPTKSHVIVLHFEAINSNPNGDPNRDNAPRMDLDTLRGYTTDVSLKRKIRDHIRLTRAPTTPDEMTTDTRFDIFIRSDHALNTGLKSVAEARGLDKGKKGKDSNQHEKAQRLQQAMLERYYDVRMFGAVLDTGDHRAGKVTGPLQVAFAESIDPIAPERLAITRVAFTEERKRQESKGHTEWGAKQVIPYGLYRTQLVYNPHLSARREDGTTFVTQEDLTVLYTALEAMFDTTRSASRPNLATRALHIATPTNHFPAHKINEAVRTERKAQVETPRQFSDYEITDSLDDFGDALTVTRHIV